VANRAAYDGRRISVRANFRTGEHATVLFDKGCPNSWLLVGKLKNDVDVSLCGNETLAQKYGCPPNPATGVRATFIGIYHHRRSDAGVIDIDLMSDIGASP
jgi:hypothetical protein